MNPTDQRLEIIPKVLQRCNLSLFEGVLLTGSMVFGKHYSVNNSSDIDFIFITDPAKISHLKDDLLFSNIDFSEDFIEAFSRQHIDRFWLDHYRDGIKINIGIWDSHFITKFANLSATSHKLGTLNPLVQEIEVVNPYGTRYTYTPELKRYKSLYIKEFQLKLEGVLVNSPSYNNLIASEILYDPKKLWAPKIEILIDSLNNNFGNIWVEPFLTYLLPKSSATYLVQLRKRINIS